MIDTGLLIRVAAAVALATALWLVVGELEARRNQRELGERWRASELERCRQLALELGTRVERLA